MKKSSLSGLIFGMAVLFLLIYVFCPKEQSSGEVYEKRGDMGFEIEDNMESGEEDNGAEDSREEADRLNMVIENNQSMIEEYLKNFPAEIKWIDVSLFDFTKDGKREIVLSEEYLSGNYTGVISCNHVYDQEGNELFEFLGGSLADMSIYADSDSMTFYLCSEIHWGSQNDTLLYSKIVKREDWEKELIIGVWDTRKEGTSDSLEEGYYIFNIPLEKEQDFLVNMYEEMIEICHDKNQNMGIGQFEEYLQSYESLEETEMDICGSIYCSQNKIIVDIDEEKAINTAESEDIDLLSRRLEMLIESNKFEDFILQSGEEVICIYEGTIDFDSINDKFALYKETAEKDIIFVNMLFIEKGTRNIYTWKGDDLVQIGVLEKAESELTDISESGTDNDLLYESITVDELLDKVMEVLEQNGCNKLNLVYDGTIEFINRKYYMVSSFEDFEDHIIREQEYYIDMKNGDIYRVDEDSDYLRTELYYIGDIK